MLPQVLRPASFNTPIAALNIDGLGLCCFNPNKSPKEWQIAFLRAGHHLTIRVRKLNPQGKIVDELDPIDIPETAQQLVLSVGNSSSNHYGVFNDGFFTSEQVFPASTGRKIKDDSYDFRWVIDLLSEVPHGSFIKLKKKSEQPEGTKITLLHIPNALFYTKKVVDESVLLAPDPKTPEDAESFVFGRTNEKVGAAIYSATPNSAAIRLDDITSGVPISIPPFDPLPAPAAGFLYEISILNMDIRSPDLSASSTTSKLPSELRSSVGNYVPGDLHRYYEMIYVSGTHHQLFAPPRTTERAIDGDCHLAGAGHNGGNLTDLTDLIQQ